jgi:hypothetical protein
MWMAGVRADNRAEVLLDDHKQKFPAALRKGEEIPKARDHSARKNNKDRVKSLRNPNPSSSKEM